MESEAKKIFEDYLLKRLKDKDAPLPKDLSGISESDREALKKKLAALKGLNKLFDELSDLDHKGRDQIVEEMVPLEGKIFAGCKIIKKLGQGGMGVVYLGKQEKLNREVAIKVLHPSSAENVSLIRRFKRESQIIARLDHENIVPVYDIGEENGSLFIIMKYIKGVGLDVLIKDLGGKDRSDLTMEDIENILKDRLLTDGDKPINLPGKNPTDFFCNVVVKVAKALEYAHHKGIIHRDIKPSNILILASGKPILLDFGLGRNLGEASKTLTGEFLGTPVYSAPEGFKKKNPIRPRLLDVYSLGVTLYEALTGALPYKGDSVYEIYSSLKDEEPVQPKAHWKELPQDLNTVILKAIYKDSNFRYASIEAFREDLERFLGYKPILAKPPSIFNRIYYFSKRHKFKVMALSLLPFLIAALIYSLFLYQDLQQTRIQKTVYKQLAFLDQITRDRGKAAWQGMFRLYDRKVEQLLSRSRFRPDPSKPLPLVIRELEGEVKDHPKDTDLLGLLGSAYLENDDFNKAKKMGKRILELDPKNETAYLILADVLIVQEGDIQEAIPLIREFNKNFPSDPMGSALLGARCMVDKNYECAIDFFSMASRQDPGRYLFLAALAYGSKRDYLNMVELFEKTLNYHPQDALLYHFLALGYAKLDRYEAALGAAKKSQILDPSDENNQILIESLEAHAQQAIRR